MPCLPRGRGKPDNIMPNLATPEIGVAILTTESRPGTKTGHIGKVTAVFWDRVGFIECNYSGYRKDGVWIATCGYRELPIDSPLIRGYWKCPDIHKLAWLSTLEGVFIHSPPLSEVKNGSFGLISDTQVE